MRKQRIETITAILTSEYWLLFSLSGIFFGFFARNSGAHFFSELCGVFVILGLLLGTYRIEKIPRWHLITAAICGYLVLASVLNPYAHSNPRYIKRLVSMVIIVFAIHFLSKKEIDERVTFFFGVVLVLTVCWQFGARYLYHMPFGTYTKNHYLASFAALALPLIVYFFLVTKGWFRIIFIPVSLLDADLLLQTGSRSAYFAVTCGALFCIIFLTKGRHKWLGILSMVLIFAVLYFTDYADVVTKVRKFVLNVSSEKRFDIWIDTWKILMDNSFLAWIVGNGIGSFHASFVKFADPQFKHVKIVFSHLYFLDILFENGILGVVLVFSGLSFVFCAAIQRIKSTVDKRKSILLRCLLTLFVIWFIHCSMTFPFYSTYSLYPLAYILGTVLVLLETRPSEDADTHVIADFA